jgi:hypothetical protein
MNHNLRTSEFKTVSRAVTDVTLLKNLTVLEEPPQVII